VGIGCHITHVELATTENPTNCLRCLRGSGHPGDRGTGRYARIGCAAAPGADAADL